MNERTPMEKYRVKPKLLKYATVKGKRSFENRCFKCAIGPERIVNLIFEVKYNNNKMVFSVSVRSSPEHD